MQAAAPDAKLDAGEERTILEVVAHPSTLRLFGPRRVELTPETELWAGHAVLDNGHDDIDIAVYDSAQKRTSGERVRIQSSLIDSLRARNRRAMSLRNIRRPPKPIGEPRSDQRTETWGRIALSRPGISADGLSALVAVTRSDFAIAGYVIYLEKRRGIWTVVGEGAAWVV
jgi:hypothetical protein